MIDQAKIHNQCLSYNPIDRYAAVENFNDFLAFPNKQLAWDDLRRLVNDRDSTVRFEAVHAFSSAFSYLPNKQQAWKDLIELTSDDIWLIRSVAANTLGSAFSQVPDKQQAWNDLHFLTDDENSDVKEGTASAIGTVFSQVPDKQQAWDDINRLINDEDSEVRTYANYSLGKICIFQASQAENEENYKKELEKAIEFFEKAAESSKHRNPSSFCLPFYRSFHTIIFKKQEAEEEVNKYLAEAKAAIEDSRSKKLLIEAVENLSNALKEVQNMKKMDLEAKKGELNFYRNYCNHAAELIRNTEETAPSATEVLRKGLPILDRNIKGLLEEIQRKAEIACKEAKGTATEEIACTINREVQEWEISNQEEMTQKVEDLAYILKTKVAELPENELF